MATILFQEADELYEQQIQEWDPVLKWFCKRYGVKLEAARDISGPIIDQETKNVLTKHLLSYNFWAIHGRFYIAFIPRKCLKIKVYKTIILVTAKSEFFMASDSSFLK